MVLCCVSGIDALCSASGCGYVWEDNGVDRCAFVNALLKRWFFIRVFRNGEGLAHARVGCSHVLDDDENVFE